MIVMRKVAYIVSALVLAGCGGGDSGNNTVSVATNSVPVQQSPATISLSINKTFVRTGETLTITWGSTNSSSCTASGNWNGIKAKSGSETFEVTTAGKLNYILECSGTGGTAAKQIQSVIVPYPVYKTSYENKNLIAIDTTQVPTIRTLKINQDSDESDSIERSVTFGDFFQEGQYAAFVAVSRHKNVYNGKIPEGLPDSPAKAYFLSLDESGQWKDRTTELIKNPEDRNLCIFPSYSITADFNNDKVPDIFVSCSGVDYFESTFLNQFPNAHIDFQWVFLSQPDKTYKASKLPFKLFSHQATAADFNNDGNIDIGITRAQIGTPYSQRIPFVLLGNGDGTFLANETFFASLLTEGTGNEKYLGQIFQIQTIPVDGRIDLIMMGHGPNNVEETISYWKGKLTGGFEMRYNFNMPNSIQTGKRLLMPLDVVRFNNNYYFMTNAQDSVGTHWEIIKFDSSFNKGTSIWQWSNFSSNFAAYSAQFKPTRQSSLVAYTAGCGLPLSGMCALEVIL
jgi:hypothetical protein